jgi:hypothetical protein
LGVPSTPACQEHAGGVNNAGAPDNSRSIAKLGAVATCPVSPSPSLPFHRVPSRRPASLLN